MTVLSFGLAYPIAMLLHFKQNARRRSVQKCINTFFLVLRLITNAVYKSAYITKNQIIFYQR